ncbi:MAG: hypothetical protein ACLTYN_09095 [Dysosmobacter welbionis]
MNEREADLHRADWRGSQLGLSASGAYGPAGRSAERSAFCPYGGHQRKRLHLGVLSAILTAAGAGRGMHLRICSGTTSGSGEWEISDQDFCLAAEAVNACAEHMADPPRSAVDSHGALALQQVRCRIVVLEVGGRMDATTSSTPRRPRSSPSWAAEHPGAGEHTPPDGGRERHPQAGCAAVSAVGAGGGAGGPGDVRAPGRALVVTEEVRPAGGGWTAGAGPGSGGASDWGAGRLPARVPLALDTVDVLNARGASPTGCPPGTQPYLARRSLLRRDPWVIVDGAPSKRRGRADSLRQCFPGRRSPL